jgi:zinc transporter ZupT
MLRWPRFFAGTAVGLAALSVLFLRPDSRWWWPLFVLSSVLTAAYRPRDASRPVVEPKRDVSTDALLVALGVFVAGGVLWLIWSYVWSFVARHTWDIPHLSIPEVAPVWARLALAGVWLVATSHRFVQHKRRQIA